MPRKRIRKGTHSCLECGRRKTRCVFAPDTQICNGCASRRLACTDQEYSAIPEKKKKTTQVREEEREILVRQVLQRLGAIPELSNRADFQMSVTEALSSLRCELLPSTFTAVDVPASRQTSLPESSEGDITPTHHHRFGKAPLLSLFDNDVLKYMIDEGTETGSLAPASKGHAPVTEKTRRVLKALRALAPNPHDLTLILQASRYSCGFWKTTFPDLAANYHGFGKDWIPSLQTYICQTLESNNAAIISKILLFLALCMQQIPRDFDFSCLCLPASSEALQDHFLTSAETLLASDEGCACTFEGLECMMLQTKIYVNIGKPHKAWLIFRRAVGIAHLLGLHRQLKNIGDQHFRYRRALWLQIWQGERYLSLLLGLPCAASDAHVDMQTVQNEGSNRLCGETLLLRLGVITGQLIDRNQGHHDTTFLITMKIDQDLIDCKDLVSASWWETLPDTHMSLDAAFDMFFAKFSYHNVRKLLHLPFMLQSSTDRRYEYSRFATLDSSREMIKYYQIMRDVHRPLLTVCNVAEFQVFTAAVILILDLLGDRQPRLARDSEQRERNWDIVRSITQDLKRVSTETPCSVATQAARTLEDLHHARYNYSHGGNEIYEAVIPLEKFELEREEALLHRQILSQLHSYNINYGRHQRL